MTLPASFPLSMSQIATEIGLPLPLSFNHPWILQLAQVGSLPLALSQLLGKTGRFDGNLLGHTTGSPLFIEFLTFAGEPFFGGTLSGVQAASGGTGVVTLTFSVAPNWNGNIFIQNNTTVTAVVLGKISSTQWQAAGAGANFIRPAVTDNFTVLPTT
jgi:hypothetical protein